MTRVSDNVVRLGPLEHVDVRVVRHTGPTMFSLLQDVLGGYEQGVPGPWRQAVRHSLPPAVAMGMHTLFSSSNGWGPECLALTQTLENADIRQVLDELDGLDAGRLPGEVEAFFGGDPPAPWRRVLDQPQGFLDSYRHLISAAWAGFAPRWSQVDALYAREVSRLGVAAVSGGLDVVLNTLGPPVRFTDGSLSLRRCHRWQRRRRENRRRLVLVPLASGTTAHLYSIGRGDTVWIGYPLPGLSRLMGDRVPPAPRDPLALLLGPVRAAIMRQASPDTSVSDLAGELHIGISTATYHCDQLAKADLVKRERHGKKVYVRQTDRGTDLIALLTAN